MSPKITVDTVVNVPIEKAWETFTEPEHVMKWNNASDDWHTPRAENDLRVGGKFNYRMEAKDGSSGFDFAGVYSQVIPNQKFSYAMSDGRTVDVVFEKQGGGTRIIETFDPEIENSPEFQKTGWQSILDNFKKYAEEN